MLCGAHLGLQEIWSRASPKGSTSLSCFQEHKGRHTKDRGIFCMKVLDRMARQPKQGDLMHKKTQRCPSLLALCTVFIPGCKQAPKTMLHYLECPIQHRYCTETICNAFVVLCTVVLFWAAPRFLLEQKFIDSKAYKGKYCHGPAPFPRAQQVAHREKGGDSSKQV